MKLIPWLDGSVLSYYYGTYVRVGDRGSISFFGLRKSVRSEKNAALDYLLVSRCAARVKAENVAL